MTEKRSYDAEDLLNLLQWETSADEKMIQSYSLHFVSFLLAAWRSWVQLQNQIPLGATMLKIQCWYSVECCYYRISLKLLNEPPPATPSSALDTTDALQL